MSDTGISVEKAVLDCFMLNETAAASVSKVPPVAFTGENRQLFNVMLDLYQAGLPLDHVSLDGELRKRNPENPFSSVGGFDNFLQLGLDVPTTSNYRYYVDQLIEKYRIRELMNTVHVIQDMGEKCDSQTLIKEAEDRIAEITKATKECAIYDVSEVLDQEIPDDKTPVGFTDLDTKLGGGMGAGDLIILAARPSMGKTSLAINIAFNAALNTGDPVMFFSLEMSIPQIVSRIKCIYAEIPKNTLYISDSTDVSLSFMRAEIAKNPRLSLVVVDYLQLMEGNSSENRVQEISKISRGLKKLAREFNVPILALSQLNRAVESRSDKRPALSDLRDSGSIEQDADVVLFLYRSEYYNEFSADAKNIAEVNVSKNRHGPTGTVNLFFNASNMKFGNLERGF